MAMQNEGGDNQNRRGGQGGAGTATGGATPKIMSYEEWYIQAKKNAEAKGRPTDDATMKRSYASYVWQMKNPQGAKQHLGKPGSGTAEQKQTAQMAAGSFADDSPDAGNAHTGDPYLDELRSGNVAGSEDWRRFSNEVLKGWEQYYIGGGQYKNAYGDIVGKPTDRGPNTPAGVNGIGQPMGQGGGAGGAGGTGGGRGGGGGGANAPGLKASPATQAPTGGGLGDSTAPTPTSGAAGTTPDVYGQSSSMMLPMPTPAPSGPPAGAIGMMPSAAPSGGGGASPLAAAPATPSAWKQSGAGATAPVEPTAVPTPNTPRLNIGTPTFKMPKQPGTGGWQGGGTWVASDERLKDPLEMHFPMRKRRFSDWRK